MNRWVRGISLWKYEDMRKQQSGFQISFDVKELRNKKKYPGCNNFDKKLW